MTDYYDEFDPFALGPDKWVVDDGGREAEGLPPVLEDSRGDCVVRAIAIATGLGYRNVKDLVNGIGRASPAWYDSPYRRGTQLHREADDGVSIEVCRRVLENELRWTRHYPDWPSRRFVLRRFPMGRVVVSCRRHLAAVVDGRLHDTWDSTKGQRALILSYWTPPAPLVVKP